MNTDIKSKYINVVEWFFSLRSSHKTNLYETLENKKKNRKKPQKMLATPMCGLQLHLLYIICSPPYIVNGNSLDLMVTLDL